MILKPTKTTTVNLCRGVCPHYFKNWYLGYFKTWARFYRHRKTNKLLTKRKYFLHNLRKEK